MINSNEIQRLLRTTIKQNGSTILSGVAAFGVLSTAYLTGKASYKVARDEDADPWASNQEKVKRYWKLYIPAGMSAASTLICIAGADRISARKMIAAQSALAVTQRVYSEYKEHVVEELGEKKEREVRAKVAEDQVRKNPPSAKDQLLLVGNGNVLCCELFTGRYFGSDMESLKRAQNEINAKMIKHDYATLDDLYYLLNLNPTTESGHIGWTSEKLLEFEFDTVLTEDNRPCLTFAYNYQKVL